MSQLGGFTHGKRSSHQPKWAHLNLGESEGAQAVGGGAQSAGLPFGVCGSGRFGFDELVLGSADPRRSTKDGRFGFCRRGVGVQASRQGPRDTPRSSWPTVSSGASTTTVAPERRPTTKKPSSPFGPPASSKRSATSRNNPAGAAVTVLGWSFAYTAPHDVRRGIPLGHRQPAAFGWPDNPSAVGTGKWSENLPPPRDCVRDERRTKPLATSHVGRATVEAHGGFWMGRRGH